MVQNSIWAVSGMHPSSYSVGTEGGFFHGCKAASLRNWPLTSMRGAMPPFPICFHGMHRDNFTALHGL